MAIFIIVNLKYIKIKHVIDMLVPKIKARVAQSG